MATFEDLVTGDMDQLVLGDKVIWTDWIQEQLDPFGKTDRYSS